MELELFYFRHPANILIAGPTGCGKTSFVQQLIHNKSFIFSIQSSKIHWFYGEWQPLYDNMSKLYNVEFTKGLPSDEMFKSICSNSIVVIDDQMNELGSQVENLFTKKSHHCNVTIILLIQNLFNKNMRTLSINSHYIVLFKNPRDKTIISSLAKQMYPSNNKFLQEAYHDATQLPYSYLLIDLRQETLEYARVRTNIFSTNEQYVYLPK